jgi:hypothetical protein
MSESNGKSNGRFQPGHKLAKGGPRPNSGPKPSEIRELCASNFYKNVPILDEIARNPKSSNKDRIAAILALAKVGIPAQHEVKNEGEIGFHPITLEGDKEATADARNN